MRWRYPDERLKGEAKERERVRAAMRRWWQEFDRRKDDCDALFKQRMSWDLPGWMNAHLRPIAENIFWEFGPGEGDGHRLALTPEGRHHLRPLVEELVGSAPSIPGWTFVLGRPPEEASMAIQSVRAKGGKDVTGATASCSAGGSGCVDVAFACKAFKKADAEEDLGSALWLTEGLLGEETLNRWVGLVGTQSARSKFAGFDLDELRPRVQALIDAHLAALPAGPIRTEGAEWTGYSLRPADPVDGDWTGQRDLIAASTMMPAMWEAAHGPRVFWSGRFSRVGEVFAHLKIEGTRRPAGAEAAYRQAISDDVDAALGEAGVGTVVGGGTGLRYAYVDVALTDVMAAIPVIRAALRGHDVPPRAWLLFNDADFAAEWVGMFPRTPPPPGLPE